MKKLFSILIVAVLFIITVISFAACSKTTNVCWHCTFGIGPDGQTKAPLDTCGSDKIGTMVFHDQYGNALNSNCQKK